jgi:hypothetical protein
VTLVPPLNRNQWIEVRIGLPRTGRKVLVKRRGGQVETAYMDNNFVGGFSTCYRSGHAVYDVSHWMPIPK